MLYRKNYSLKESLKNINKIKNNDKYKLDRIIYK